jgi:hypothetical protein
MLAECSREFSGNGVLVISAMADVVARKLREAAGTNSQPQRSEETKIDREHRDLCSVAVVKWRFNDVGLILLLPPRAHGK